MSPMNSTNLIPSKVDPMSPTEMQVGWNDGANFAVPYLELRFFCPCAGCVDEHTGQRMIKKASIRPDIRPLEILPVGRYALQVNWNDGHATGLYHYETMRRICEGSGRKI